MCLYRNTFFFLFKIYFLRSVTEQIRNTKTFWASQVLLVVKNPPANAGDVGDVGSIPGSGRSPGEEKGYPLQYSGLENSMDCIIHGVTKSQTQLNDFHLIFLNSSRCLLFKAPLSLRFSRQEYWSGLPFPHPGIFLTQG